MEKRKIIFPFFIKKTFTFTSITIDSGSIICLNEYMYIIGTHINLFIYFITVRKHNT